MHLVIAVQTGNLDLCIKLFYDDSVDMDANGNQTNEDNPTVEPEKPKGGKKRKLAITSVHAEFDRIENLYNGR